MKSINAAIKHYTAQNPKVKQNLSSAQYPQRSVRPNLQTAIPQGGDESPPWTRFAWQIGSSAGDDAKKTVRRFAILRVRGSHRSQSDFEDALCPLPKDGRLPDAISTSSP
jgi:hypothetical protein